MAINNLGSNRDLIKLVATRHSAEWEEKFLKVSGNRQKIKILWNNLAKKIEENLSGQEAKDKYHCLLKTFKAHDVNSRIGGNGVILRRHYYTLKEYFKTDPFVSPTISIDTSDISKSQNNDSIVSISETSESHLSSASKELKPHVKAISNIKKSTNNNKSMLKSPGSEIKTLNDIKKEYYRNLAKYQEKKINKALQSSRENEDIDEDFLKSKKILEKLRIYFWKF
jgi:hypothetical protein